MLCVARRSRVHDLSLLQPTPKYETHVFVVWWILSGVGEGGCGDTSSLDYEALLRSLAKRLLRNAETTNSLIRMVVQDTNLVAAKLRIHWWRTLKYVFEQQAALSLAPPLSCILLIRVTTVVSHFLSLSQERRHRHMQNQRGRPRVKPTPNKRDCASEAYTQASLMMPHGL